MIVTGREMMAEFPSAPWFEQLAGRVNRLARFKEAARWFEGSLAWQVDETVHVFDVHKGRINAVHNDPGAALFAMVGDDASWRELLEKGTINRMFRQGRIHITGDRAQAMRYWKVLWYLTETAREM